jgi:hypothetical protein
MAFSDTPQQATPARLRQFSVLCLFLCLALSIWAGELHGHYGLAALLNLVGVIVGVLGWRRPESLRWVYLAWTHAARAIAFAVFKPVESLSRRLGRKTNAGG